LRSKKTHLRVDKLPHRVYYIYRVTPQGKRIRRYGMFPNLNAELGRRKMTIKNLSEVAEINYDSLKNKMNGSTEFKRSEMAAIKSKVFPEYSIDYLFAVEEGEST